MLNASPDPLDVQVDRAMACHPRGSIVTSSGFAFTFSDPSTWRFTARDMAKSLSKLNRFVGHSRLPYSVAEHCLWVAAYLREASAAVETQFLGLVHDAAEAYTGDVNSPLKATLPTLQGLESKILWRAGAQLRWPLWTQDQGEEVHLADRIAFLTEYRDLKDGADYAFLPREVIRPMLGADWFIAERWLGKYDELARQVGAL